MTFEVGALAASTTSACCVVGSTRSPRARIAAVLTVSAMIACVATDGHPGLALLSFALAIASVPFALERRAGSVSPMNLHRALGGVVMAALAVTATAMAAHSGSPMDAHGHGIPLPVFASAFLVGYLALSAWLIVRMLRPRPAADRSARLRRILNIGEVAGMGVGMLLMGVM